MLQVSFHCNIDTKFLFSKYARMKKVCGIQKENYLIKKRFINCIQICFHFYLLVIYFFHPASSDA